MEGTRTRVGEAGRVVIPADLRRAFGIEDGQEVVFSRDEHSIRIIPLSAAVRQAQDLFARLAKPEVVLSEELLRERRDEGNRG
jgi:AbrB family looped-hinge helix DNA binding protein